jgi:hypothetical protein
MSDVIDEEVPYWFDAFSKKIGYTIAAGLWNPPHDAILINYGDNVLEPLHVALLPDSPLASYLSSQAYAVSMMSGIYQVLDEVESAQGALPLVIALSTHDRLARLISLSLSDPKIRKISLDKFMNSLTYHHPIQNFAKFRAQRAIENAKIKDVLALQEQIILKRRELGLGGGIR